MLAELELELKSTLKLKSLLRIEVTTLHFTKTGTEYAQKSRRRCNRRLWQPADALTIYARQTRRPKGMSLLRRGREGRRDASRSVAREGRDAANDRTRKRAHTHTTLRR